VRVFLLLEGNGRHLVQTLLLLVLIMLLLVLTLLLLVWTLLMLVLTLLLLVLTLMLLVRTLLLLVLTLLLLVLILLLLVRSLLLEGNVGHLVLTLGQFSVLSVKFVPIDKHRRHAGHQCGGGQGRTKADILCTRQGAPVTLPHPLGSPVYPAVVLQLGVTEPGPEEQDQQDVPDQPGGQDPSAPLQGPAHQGEVGEEGEEGGQETGADILPVRSVGASCPLGEGVTEEHEE